MSCADCRFDLTKETAWCPGCGNPSIRLALKAALEELEIPMHKVVLSAGIGQAGKMPQYIDLNAFCGLHGRSLPVAIGIKLSNNDLTVLAESGDGDNYGEGGNHLIHTIRRNINIAHFVHDNQVYGLTKGQASPTTATGQIQSMSYDGVRNSPTRPLALALTMGAGFVARGFSGDIKQVTELMKAAIQYEGYALVDILQPCIVWNKINTFKWYKERVSPIDESHDPTDLDQALKLANQWDEKIPTGILYRVEKETYDQKFGFIKGKTPISEREIHPADTEFLMDNFR